MCMHKMHGRQNDIKGGKFSLYMSIVENYLKYGGNVILYVLF